MNLLECREVKKSYGQGVSRTEVLKGISLQIEKKERSAILGASGAGKSTLLHILSALEKPDEGDVLFEGKSLKSLKDDQLSEFRNRSIGFVFQFHHLMPEFTALENAAMPLLMRGDALAYDKARHYLKKLGVDHRSDHRPSEMSGGEQQRVAVARALITEPQILFADEPTGNLDHENSQKLTDLLMKINEEFSVALVVVTHNEEVAKYFSRIIRLDDGRLQG
ncbi:MAG: ABC transporter ATP-binding protein [Deltaproteobacteria bacterium]|nr:MAG: ABC transporter ATP-binding protein [Deltaproteobacteria bacterium]